MKRGLILFLIMNGVVSSFASQILLQDLFDNSDLTSSTQIHGGFSIVGNNGSAVEDAGTAFARISNAANGASYGILSTNQFNWNPLVSGEETLRTTWNISNSDLKKSTSLLTFVWQDAADTDFAAPEIRVEVDIVNHVATLYDESGIVGNVDVDVDFGGTNDAFTVSTEFSAASVLLRGSGDLRTRELNPIDARFDASPAGWVLPFSSGRSFRVGVENLASSQGGLVVDVNSVTIEAIPEPAVASFISLFCVGLIFVRRIFTK